MEDSSSKFIALSLAWLWIVSAIIVITASIISLVKVKFKIDRVGLGVIIIYNLLFIGQLILSIFILKVSGDYSRVPKAASVINVVLKNFDIVFKAYFTFEMYRVRLWL